MASTDHSWISLLLSCVIGSWCTSLGAEQRIEMDATAIRGNKESPNILYVVPWHEAKPLSDGQHHPGYNQLDALLVPLDRDVFRRELDWYHRQSAQP